MTGITAKNKLYDGTTAATLNTSSASLHGVIPGDTLTLNTSAATGTFATKDVGTGITVTVSGLARGSRRGELRGLRADDDGEHHSGCPRRDRYHRYGQAVRRHDRGDAQYDWCGARGRGDGDMVTLITTGATGVFASKGVGTGITVTVTGLSISGADAANYTLTQPPPTTADITPAHSK